MRKTRLLYPSASAPNLYPALAQAAQPPWITLTSVNPISRRARAERVAFPPPPRVRMIVCERSSRAGSRRGSSGVDLYLELAARDVARAGNRAPLRDLPGFANIDDRDTASVDEPLGFGRRYYAHPLAGVVHTLIERLAHLLPAVRRGRRCFVAHSQNGGNYADLRYSAVMGEASAGGGWTQDPRGARARRSASGILHLTNLPLTWCNCAPCQLAN
jgi:hypothetical protein